MLLELEKALGLRPYVPIVGSLKYCQNITDQHDKLPMYIYALKVTLLTKPV